MKTARHVKLAFREVDTDDETGFNGGFRVTDVRGWNMVIPLYHLRHSRAVTENAVRLMAWLIKYMLGGGAVWAQNRGPTPGSSRRLGAGLEVASFQTSLRTQRKLERKASNVV